MFVTPNWAILRRTLKKVHQFRALTAAVSFFRHDGHLQSPPHGLSSRDRGEKKMTPCAGAGGEWLGRSGWRTLASCCLLILGLGLSGCARLPEGMRRNRSRRHRAGADPRGESLGDDMRSRRRNRHRPQPALPRYLSAGEWCSITSSTNRYVLERDLTRIERLYRARR